MRRAIADSDDEEDEIIVESGDVNTNIVSSEGGEIVSEAAAVETHDATSTGSTGKQFSAR